MNLANTVSSKVYARVGLATFISRTCCYDGFFCEKALFTIRKYGSSTNSSAWLGRTKTDVLVHPAHTTLCSVPTRHQLGSLGHVDVSSERDGEDSREIRLIDSVESANER